VERALVEGLEWLDQGVHPSICGHFCGQGSGVHVDLLIPPTGLSAMKKSLKQKPATPKKRRPYPKRVSVYSLWTDRRWQFPNPNDAAPPKASSIDWGFPMSDGGTLLEERWADLLHELRCLLWTMLHDKRRGRALSVGGISTFGVFIGSLVLWMSEEGYNALSELDAESGDEFLDYLSNSYVSKKTIGRPRVWDFNTAHRMLNHFIHIYDQRLAMRKLDVEISAEKPFQGATAHAVVSKRLGFVRSGGMAELDDGAFIELMNSSMRLLGTPADEVIKLQERYLEVLQDVGTRSIKGAESPYAKFAAKQRVTSLLRSAEFSVLPGETEPWNPPLFAYERTLLDGRVVSVAGTQLLRRIIVDIQSAAQLVLQGLGALRANTVCSASVAPPEPGKLPSCISIEPSADGSMDVFFFNGPELKITKKSEKWVMGSRPCGSEYLPPTVEAVDVLCRLLEPWRVLGRTRKLLISFSAARGLPKQKSSVGKMTAAYLTYMGKEFIVKYCDQSRFEPGVFGDIVAEFSFRGHRSRKTFARFVYRTNSRLLSAISMHFKHLSISMTERRYIGEDVELLEAMDSERVYATAQLFLGVLSGKETATGLGAKLIRKHEAEIRARLGKYPNGNDLDRAIRFVQDEEILIWPSGSGDCLINLSPRAAACHSLAGTANWRQRSPNHAARTPSVCAGCQCNIVTARNLPFWSERARNLKAVLEENRLSEDSGSFEATRKRLTVAENMVRLHS
jgi:hypothetical protein